MRLIYLIIFLVPYILYSQTIDYFPVHIGDTYEYKVNYYEPTPTVYYQRVITNIVLKSDGGRDIYYDNSLQPEYLKAANGNIYQYFNNIPSLFYDFSTASSDTFKTALYGSEYFVVVDYRGPSVTFGKSISLRQFEFHQENGVSIASHWLGEGIGVLSKIVYGNYFQPSEEIMIGCLINDIRYGTMVNVENEQLNTCLELYQNYPNPFNPTTTIKYALPEPSRVSLEIYNVLGIRVEKLVDEYQNNGFHSVDFNASKYSSGIYFYKLSSNKYQSIKKMIYIK